jgi:Zn-dependent peptidase ImmA (M78 family)/transcriptional regulator with XRE-family HTH domain
MPDNKVIPFPTKAVQSAVRGRLLTPSRLSDARKALCLSQEELGKLAGVTQHSISAYECGDKTPELATLHRIAEILRQSVNFFTSQDCPSFGHASSRFYRGFGAGALCRNEACNVISDWYVQVVRYLDDFVNFPAVVFPECGRNETSGRYDQEQIDNIALKLRKMWGLGLGPISNVLSLFENKGIVVCRYELSGQDAGAFSFWSGDRPFVFMASEKSASVRLRFDLAHELGHLVLHGRPNQAELEDKTKLKLMDSEANRFASAFLLPCASFPHEVHTLRLDGFLPLKKRWKVSIQDMTHRCRDLGIIDDDQALNLYKQISFRKWRKREPLDNPEQIPLEEPRLLRRAFELVLGSGRKQRDEVLSELRLSANWIETLCNLPRGTLQNSVVARIEPRLK